ncbi:MAG: SDR family NAD(P)-dependent oxidoreductase, partial [bacterium]
MPKSSRRVALVTGGGRGIGREIALALARDGLADAVAARTPTEVAAVAAAVRALGVPAESIALDVTDPDAVTAAARAVAEALGPVDVLVNNAGIAESRPFAKADLAHWERH